MKLLALFGLVAITWSGTYFVGTDKGLEWSRLITRDEMAIVSSRAHVDKGLPLISSDDGDHLRWAEEHGYMSRRERTGKVCDTVSYVEAQQIAHQINKGEKPYFLPQQLPEYEVKQVTRGYINSLIKP